MALSLGTVSPPMVQLDETWHGEIVGHGPHYLDVREDGQQGVWRYEILDWLYMDCVQQGKALGADSLVGLRVTGTPEGETGLVVSRPG